MSASFTSLDSQNGESEWGASFDTDTDSELIQTYKGNRRHKKRIRNIIIIVVIAAILIIIVALGIAISRKSGKDKPITVTEWLTTSCSNIDTQPSCPWQRGNPVLLVAMGGFRADYLNRNTTPVLNKLRTCGVQTPYLRPVYPTKSSPNQYTIVTTHYSKLLSPLDVMCRPESVCSDYAVFSGSIHYAEAMVLIFSCDITILYKKFATADQYNITIGNNKWILVQHSIKDNTGVVHNIVVFVCSQGRYPESHGMVNDGMYDSKMNAEFNGTETNPAWWGGEPLWVTAKKQGKKSAACRWAGSNVDLSDARPELLCNGTKDKQGMVSTVIGWLTMAEDDRPDFITLYMDEPGVTGRSTGPASPEVYLMVKQMDTMIGKLMAGLHSHNLDNCVNIIILSDHGMSETSCLRQLSLDYILEDAPEMKHLLKYGGTSGTIYTSFKRSGSEIVDNKDEILLDDAVDTLACKSSHLKAFTSATIPIRHHYSNNERIGEIVLDVEDKWLLLPDETKKCPKGSNGYDEVNIDMHAMFLAYGPDLKHNLKTEPFESIELYNLMSDLLGIKPAPNNGTKGTLSHLLRTSPMVSEDKVDISTCTGDNNLKSACDCKLPRLELPDSLIATTFPFGSPGLQDNVTACFLYGRQFSTIYSTTNKQPIIVSYQLMTNQAQNFKYEETHCSIPDHRLTDSVNPDCMEYGSNETEIVAVHLYDHGFGTTEDEIAESYLSSNVVPMHKTFKEETWSFLWSLLKQYAIAYKRVHVSVGPIFDGNHDGKADKQNEDSFVFVKSNSRVPVPTHFFVILTKCSEDITDITVCKEGNLDVLSFVLPHVNKDSDCQSDENYLKDNMVRIRDIELLTGLRLLTKFETNVAARKRTFLPFDLWPSTLLAHWVDLPCDEENACQSDYKPLLLLSFDGFRADYLNRNLTRAMEKLRSCGVRTPYMRSVFPTETYPNHQTIVTGLYPESHGIVENYMYDSTMNSSFDEHTEMHSEWWGGEPIWTTAEKQGKRSASIMWIGSHIDDPAKQPSIMSKVGLKESDTLQHGIEQMISWLMMEEGKRPDLITFYAWQPDDQGHEFGPDSSEINDELKYVDSLIQLLMDGLLRKNLHNCVNIMIVSDHGMAEESCQKQIVLSHYFPGMDDVLSVLGTTGIINTHFKEEGSSVIQSDAAPSVKELMEAFECKNKHFLAYTKETLPVRYHYTNNHRIGDMVLDVSDGWMINTIKRKTCGKGNHGYDPAFTNMRAVFMAHGPAFKQNFDVEPFENIELYNIMSDILGVTPAQNNGTVGALENILRKTSENEDETLLLGIERCNGTTERSSTCDCAQSVSGFPPGEHKYHGGLALQEDTLSMCFLVNPLFTTVYSKDNKQPAMVSFLITPKQVNINPITPASCVIPDTKLSDEENPDCKEYENMEKNITRVHLFNPEFASTTLEGEEVKLSSNLVPMYSGFLQSIWRSVLTTMGHYAIRYKMVHVSVGPVFDSNFDSLADIQDVKQEYVTDSSKVPVPTHFFVVLLKCKYETVAPVDCETSNIDVLSFILPHVNRIPNCLHMNVFLKKNVVRLKDVELQTGLRFFTEVEWTLAARKRTHLPTELWSFD